jgi:hypothetical protein
MLKHTIKGALAEAKMLYHGSKRTKRPTIIVEGDYDLRVFQRVMNKKLVYIKSYDYGTGNNKIDLISLVRKLDDLDKEKDHQNYVIGVVDADCDVVIDKVYKSNFLPYAKNIFDTSPYTDLNLLLTSRSSFDGYLSSESLSASDFKRVLNLLMGFSIIRILKKRFEDVKKKTVHLYFSDLKSKLLKEEVKVPDSIEELVKEFESVSRNTLKNYSNSPTKIFFDYIRHNDRLEKVHSELNDVQVKYYQYVNGHDLSFSVSLFGSKSRNSQIEERLMNPESLDYLKQTKLFTRLREWGNLHSIELF